MNLIEDIKKIYNTRTKAEQIFLSQIIDLFSLLDYNSLNKDDNHSFIKNDSILTISLQHILNKDRLVLVLFQHDFIEIQFAGRVEIIYLIDFEQNKVKIEDFRSLFMTILKSSYTIIEYFKDDKLIKYLTVWDNQFFPDKITYVKLFGLIKEKLTLRNVYHIKEKRIESFLIN